MQDEQGRRYAHALELTKGDHIVCGGGFSCCDADQSYEVDLDYKMRPFIRCRDGRHYLGDNYVVGFYVRP